MTSIKKYRLNKLIKLLNDKKEFNNDEEYYNYIFNKTIEINKEYLNNYNTMFFDEEKENIGIVLNMLVKQNKKPFKMFSNIFTFLRSYYSIYKFLSKYLYSLNQSKLSSVVI